MKKFFRHFSWILTLPLFLIVGAFAVANMESVALDFWPFQLTYPVPASFLILGSVFAGFLIGGLVTWASAGRQRRRARAARNRIALLEREVQILHSEKALAEAKAAAGGRAETVLLQRSNGPSQSAA